MPQPWTSRGSLLEGDRHSWLRGAGILVSRFVKFLIFLDIRGFLGSRYRARERSVEVQTESREDVADMRDPGLQPLQRQVEVGARPWRKRYMYVLALVMVVMLFLILGVLHDTWELGIVGGLFLAGMSRRALGLWRRQQLDHLLELVQQNGEAADKKKENQEENQPES